MKYTNSFEYFKNVENKNNVRSYNRTLIYEIKKQNKTYNTEY